jgi:hypothetical protein
MSGGRPWIDREVTRRRVIVGWNSEPGRHFGRHRERLFTALFIGPIIVGIGTRKRGTPSCVED